MVLDTLQLKKDLERDFTPAQAEVLVRALQQHVVEDLATRRDVEVATTDLRTETKTLGSELRAEIKALATKIEAVETGLRAEIKALGTKVETIETELRAEIKNLGTELRSEMAQLEARLRSEIKDLKVDMVRWIVGALLINFFGVAGLMITLIKTIH